VFVQLANPPLAFHSSSTAIVGSHAHLIGSRQSHSMHLCFSEAGGWVTEADIPFKVKRGGAMSGGNEFWVLGGAMHTREAHLYDTLTKRWTASDLPVTLDIGRACYLSPTRVLVHSDEGVLLGKLPFTPTERRERERVAAEAARVERERAEAERQGRERLERERQRVRAAKVAEERRLLQSLLTTADIDPASIASSPLTEALIPHLVARIHSLEERERQRLASYQAFEDFTPDMRETVQTLIQRVKTVDMEALSAAIGHMSTYAPLAWKTGTQLSRLKGFLSQQPLKKIPSEDCAAMHRSLSSLCTPFCATLHALSACAFDPVKALHTIRETEGLVSGINAIRLIPLPHDTLSLSLEHQTKYFQVEEYNGDVRSLYRVAGPLIACADSIQLCLGRVGGTVDMNVCEVVQRESQALLKTLARLAPQQKQALELVREYEATPTVTPSDIECAEYDVSVAEVAARNPRLSEQQKRQSARQIKALQKKVVDMAYVSDLKRSQATRQRLADKMGQYLEAEVVDVNGTVGMMVKRCDTVQSH
ncbi:hypothetical protein KIPB_007866, partial [Kipferlia bialata]